MPPPAAAHADVTVDHLLDRRVTVRQPRSGYRVGIDAVLAAAGAPARPGDRVADIGAGVGSLGLCLAARVPGTAVLGLEVDPGLAALARCNATASGLADRVWPVAGDLARGLGGLRAGGFDQVVTNPPFHQPTSPSPDRAKRRAHGDGSVGLADWLGLCGRLLESKGWLTVIVRADRLDEVIACLADGFGAITVVPIYPKSGLPAKRAVVRARRGVRSPAELAPGLILHADDTAYTQEADRVLRTGAGLWL